MATTEDLLAEKMNALRAEYAAHLPNILAELNKNYELLQAAWHPLLFKELHRSVHQLAGEGGSYGFASLSESARPLDSMLQEIKQRATPLDSIELVQIGVLIKKINAAATPPPPPPTTPAATAPSDSEQPSPPKVNYLYLATHDSRLGQYLNLQWHQIESNWKALQWRWDNATFTQLSAQVRVLLENSAAFQFFELHNAAQHTDKCLHDLKLQENTPGGFQLAQLNQQMLQLAAIAAPIGENSPREKAGSSRMRQGKTLKLSENDHHLNAYLLLQVQETYNLWQTLQWNWHSEILQQLREQITVLEKNALNFVLDELQQCAHTLIQALSVFTGVRVPNPNELVQLNRLHDKLQAVAQRLFSNLEEETVEEDGLKRIYVVEDDPFFAKYLSLQLEQAGYSVRLFERLTGLVDAVKRKPPAALLVDIVLAEGDLAGPKAMFQIQKDRAQPLPVVFMSARTDMKARLAAVRAQGDAYFTKPLDMEALLAKLEAISLGKRPQATVPKVLIVDNTQNNDASQFATILRNAGLEAKILSEPLRFLEALEKLKPDLILIHAHLNGLNTTELATVVRQQPQYAKLPLIFYGMHFDETWKVPVARGVVDDLLGENIPPGQLLSCVLTRLHQSGNEWVT
jgi:DNA-binding response OmpR family regulator